MVEHQPVNPFLDIPLANSTAALLAAPIPAFEHTNLPPYDRLTTARHFMAMPESDSPMSKACLNSMIYQGKMDEATGSVGIPDPNRYNPVFAVHILSRCNYRC